MAHKIILRKRFQNKVIKLLGYLEKEWGIRIATRFANRLNKYLLLIAERPNIGTPSELVLGIRSCIITKHNRLYYRIEKNKVIVINMFDTRMNPRRNPY